MLPTLALLMLAPGNPPVVPVPAPLPSMSAPLCAPGMPGGPCPPSGPPAPLLSVRVLAPEGVAVQFTPEVAASRSYPAPASAGFRPGYRYTIRLAGLPGRPANESLYAVLEVHGSLVPRNGLNVLDYPAPLAVTRADIERALAGSLITKVVYLEDPAKAIPQAATPDQPLEFTELSEREALAAARDNGRLVAVLRFGDRRLDPEGLAAAAVPNTVLLPGEKFLAAPPCPPHFAAFGVATFDPILGPKPATEECLTDGGDKGPRLGVGPGNRLGGLNATDVAAEFTAGGRRRVATSNEVCICAPRYVIRKVEVVAGGIQTVAGLDVTRQAAMIKVGSANLVPGATVAREKPVGLVSRARPAITVVSNGVVTFEGVTRLQGLVTLAGLKVVVGSLEVDEITNAPDQFVVTKSVEPHGPVKSGDTVTFTIRYRNATKFPATDVVLSDSLSGRLEYVPGSAEQDRPSNVTTADNEAGSSVVRFEIPGPIAPGASGLIKFRAKVR